MFFDNFSKLCQEHGISVYKACEDIGLNRSAVAKWKKGTIPNGSTLQKIANHFDTSVAALLGEPVEKEKPDALKSVELTEKDLYYIERIKQLTPDQQVLLDALFKELEKR